MGVYVYEMQQFYDGKRSSIIAHLRSKGFTPKAAAKAAEAYIETQLFVAAGYEKMMAKLDA